MRAGLLREFITIWRYTNVQSESGQIKKQKTEVLTTRARVKEQSGYEKEVAKELFETQKIKFTIRYHSNIKETDIIEYRNVNYKIDFIKYDLWDDRALTITAVKINE